MDKALQIIKNIKGRFAAGISGGADSMCLLSLVVEAGRSSDATVLHINHCIRKESEQDLLLVKNFCLKNGIDFKAFNVDVVTLAKQNKTSIETEARLLRHGIFLDFCKIDSLPLLLAHNLDDNVETLLMHIFRGCGINGLIGMSEIDGYIIRPLLQKTKKEIYEYVKHNNIPFLEDVTNLDTNYRRNNIRYLIPKIEKSFPNTKQALISLSKIAKDTQKFLDSQLDCSYFKKDGNAVLLNKKALKSHLANQYLLKSIKMVGLNTDFEQKHIKLIIDLADLKNGKSICLPHGLRVFNEYDFIAFEFNFPFLNKEYDIKFGKNTDLKIEILKCKPAISKCEIIVDFDKIKNAKLRYRRDGDRFYPCEGKPKKLKDFFNEKKIPLRKRDRLPLIAIDNEVLVIGDIQLSEKVKITDKTTNACLIKLIDKSLK